MTRVTVALLALLLVVGQASAECAWVLWNRDFPTSVNTPGFPPGVPHELARSAAFSSRAECMSAAKAAAGNGSGYTVHHDDRGSMAVFPDGVGYEFQCWPDTIDPREAKGK